MLRHLVRDPLAHFVLLGAGLFLALTLVSPEGFGESRTRTVVIDRDALTTFIQYRTRAFEPRVAAARLAAMSKAERRALIDEYVREEVLYHEALALGLEKDDYVIKRRLIQKVDFITRSFAQADSQPDEAELRAYFETHAGDYYVQPWISFTHIFFSADSRGAEGALSAAREARARLQRNGVRFVEATRYGDRFPHHVNYVERTQEYVSAHFGRSMANALFALEPSEGEWYGPLRSPYGAHVVMIAAIEPERLPALAEIRGLVEDDARRARIQESADAAVRDIVASYNIRIAPGIHGSSGVETPGRTP